MALTDTTVYCEGGGTNSAPGVPIATIEAHVGYNAASTATLNPKGPCDAPNVGAQSTYTGTVISAVTYSGVRFSIPA